jgi:hypothetical protein
MNIPGKIASSTLIFIGFAWLVSLFFNPKTWMTRSANQVDGTVQNGLTSQGFNTTNGNVPLAAGTQSTIDQGRASTQSMAVRQVPQSVTSPDQSVQTTASPSPAATIAPATTAPIAPSPVVTTHVTPAPQPSPKLVPEPVRAGW